MSPTFGQGISSRRIWAVGIGFALLLMLGLARFFQLQVLQHDTWLKRKEHERRRYEITAARGVILDRDAEVLARDAPCTSLFAEPRRMRDPAGTAAVLASELAVSADMLKERFFRHGGFVWLARCLDSTTAARIQADIDRVGAGAGVGMRTEHLRLYLHGAPAVNTVGQVDSEGTPLSGVELDQDAMLRSHDGFIEEWLDGRGYPIKSRTEMIPAQNGRDVRLSLALEVQTAAVGALARGGNESDFEGEAMVMDARSGEILALAVEPHPDPNNFPEHTKAADLANPVAQTTFTSPEVFELLLTAVGLDSGVLDEAKAASLLKIPFSPASIDDLIGGPMKLKYQFDRRGALEHLEIYKVEGLPTIPGAPRNWSDLLSRQIRIETPAVTPAEILSLFATLVYGGPRVRPTVLLQESAQDNKREPGVFSAGTSAAIRSAFGGGGRTNLEKGFFRITLRNTRTGRVQRGYLGFSKSGQWGHDLVAMVATTSHDPERLKTVVNELLNSTIKYFEVARFRNSYGAH